MLDTERQVQNVDALNFLSSFPLLFLRNLPVFLLSLTNFCLRFHSCLSLFSLLKMRWIWND
jgi:hypothetical protein